MAKSKNPKKSSADESSAIGVVGGAAAGAAAGSFLGPFGAAVGAVVGGVVGGTQSEKVLAKATGKSKGKTAVAAPIKKAVTQVKTATTKTAQRATDILKTKKNKKNATKKK